MRDSKRYDLSAVAVLVLAILVYSVYHVGRLFLPEFGFDAPAGEFERGDLLVPEHLPPGPAVELLQRRSALKAQIATEVLDGRRPFWRAVAAFRDLHEDEQSRLLMLRLCHPGATEKEAFARNVLQFMRGAARDDPSKLEMVGRLEQELDLLIETGELPSPD